MNKFGPREGLAPYNVVSVISHSNDLKSLNYIILGGYTAMMTKEDLIKLGLSDEQVNEIFKLRGKEIEANKVKVAALETEKANLESDKASIETELNELKENVITPEAVTALETEKSNLEAKISELTENHAKELTSVQYNHLLDSSLKEAGVKSLKFVKLALAELGDEAVKLEDGKLVGLDDALKTLKEDKETSVFFEKAKPAEEILSFTDKSTDEGKGAQVDAFDAAVAKVIGK